MFCIGGGILIKDVRGEVDHGVGSDTSALHREGPLFPARPCLQVFFIGDARCVLRILTILFFLLMSTMNTKARRDVCRVFSLGE